MPDSGLHGSRPSGSPTGHTLRNATDGNQQRRNEMRIAKRSLAACAVVEGSLPAEAMQSSTEAKRVNFMPISVLTKQWWRRWRRKCSWWLLVCVSAKSGESETGKSSVEWQRHEKNNLSIPSVVQRVGREPTAAKDATCVVDRSRYQQWMSGHWVDSVGSHSSSIDAGWDSRRRASERETGREKEREKQGEAQVEEYDFSNRSSTDGGGRDADWCGSRLKLNVSQVVHLVRAVPLLASLLEDVQSLEPLWGQPNSLGVWGSWWLGPWPTHRGLSRSDGSQSNFAYKDARQLFCSLRAAKNKTPLWSRDLAPVPDQLLIKSDLLYFYRTLSTSAPELGWRKST